MIPVGRSFYKMSGSGNDFVFIDARTESRGALNEVETIQRVCARGTGVGADGIVFLEPSNSADIRLTYINADGSPADFCGNATLCTTRLAAELGIGTSGAVRIETDSRIVIARHRAGPCRRSTCSRFRISGRWWGDIPLATGEQLIGYALVGVPHLVIRCSDVSTVDVVGRGRPLRSHPTLPHGANVNFVSRDVAGRWRYRTYERGVEAETLACGSGAVATGILLTAWGEAEPSHPVEIQTRSGKLLRVRLERSGAEWMPSLSGEGRVVYQGRFSEI